MKICLVGVRGHALLRAGTGGSEKQIALLARHFVRRGHRVTLLVTDHAGPDLRVDGVTLGAAWDSDRGVRRIRAATYRFPTLAARLRRERADLYYVRGATAFSSVVLTVARRLDAPGLLGLASDRDLYPDSGQVILQLGSSRRHRAASYLAWLALQRRSLHLADALVAQNTAQAALCAAMGLPHVLIPSIVEEPTDELVGVEPTTDVVWVGNVHTDARRSKGVGALAEVASRLGDVSFAVVGTLTAGRIGDDVARLEALPNVRFLGDQPYDSAQRCIARSRIVLNTSPAEGFSNVMLEGWALARPALTLTVDPSDLLGQGTLGRCAGGSVDRLVELIVESLADEAWLAAVGLRAREYVRVTHGADAVCSRYEQLAVALP